MFTAPNNLDLKDLLHRLGFKKLALADLDPKRELDSCLSAHKQIWERVDATNYTDHGLAHSLNILNYFDQLGPL